MWFLKISNIKIYYEISLRKAFAFGEWVFIIHYRETFENLI